MISFINSCVFIVTREIAWKNISIYKFKNKLKILRNLVVEFLFELLCTISTISYLVVNIFRKETGQSHYLFYGNSCLWSCGTDTNSPMVGGHFSNKLVGFSRTELLVTKESSILIDEAVIYQIEKGRKLNVPEGP